MTIRQLIAAAVLALVAAGAVAADKLKVVYHLSEPDKTRFVLNNMRNHIKGVGGPEHVELVLVVHGPALEAFHDLGSDDRVRAWTEELTGVGVTLNACGNTMRAQGVETDDLLPGFVRVDQGGVVRLAELQSQGYLYIRP